MMETGQTPMYRVQEFARLAGVTVRALRYYDQLNLLRPRRTAAGHRQYAPRDLERLEQIVTLRFIGLPLAEIRAMLGSGSAALPEALRRQRRALERKRHQLDRAIDAIRRAESVAAEGRTPDASLLKDIIEEIRMQESENWTKQYYSEAAQERIEERRKLWSPELQEQVSRQWLELIAEVQQALDRGEDPASPRGQELAGRWKTLVEGFTGGDPEIAKGLAELWAGRASWPAQAKSQMQPFRITPEMFAFVHRAREA